MSLFTKLANDAFSPVDAAGNKRSVENLDAQRWGTEVERMFSAFQAGGGIIFPTLAAANEALNYQPNQMAWVLGDSTNTNNGIYRKIGASGSGSWVRLGDLPYSIIPMTNAGAGTPDAIVATSSLPAPSAPGAALFSVNIVADNTGPVTINGKPWLTNVGNDFVAGGIKAGGIYLFLDNGDAYRAVTDQDVSALVAAAEQAVVDAQAASQAAALAAGSVQRTEFATAPLAEASEPDAIPAFIRTAGLRDADDGGGGLYASPVEAEPAIGPKLFNAHVNRWFTGSETVMDIMRFGARRLGSGTPGVIADNNAALADAKEWLHGRAIETYETRPRLEFGQGIYDFEDFPNFAWTKTSLVGRGVVRLRHHGAGAAVSLDGASLPSTQARHMVFHGFTIEPGPGTTDAFYLNMVHNSLIGVDARGAGSGYSGISIGGAVCTVFDRPTVTINEGGWVYSAPTYGMTIGGAEQCCYCEFRSPVIEGMPIGISLVNTLGNAFISGTSEGCSQVGVSGGANVKYDSFYKVDFEVNSAADIQLNGSEGVSFIECDTDKAVYFVGDTKNCRVIGGTHKDIQLQATTRGNLIADLGYNRTYGMTAGDVQIIDAGQRNVVRNCYDMLNDKMWRRPKQTITPTPAGTVYTYQNPYGDPIVLSLVGGTVEGIVVDGEGVAAPSVSGGQYIVPPGVTVQWDASVAPTAKVWGF